jgi:spoIIIJ-associated protein
METQKTVQNLVEELLTKLNIKAKITVTLEGEKYLVQLNTETEAPYLIGKYGETLSSFQRIIESMLFKELNSQVDVVLKVNYYRERQKERLEKIAENIALRVKEQKREAYLRSFSAYERKIIHEYIALNHPELQSRSEDEGYERKLVVSFKDANTESPSSQKEVEDDTIADLL